MVRSRPRDGGDGARPHRGRRPAGGAHAHRVVQGPRPARPPAGRRSDRPTRSGRGRDRPRPDGRPVAQRPGRPPLGGDRSPSTPPDAAGSGRRPGEAPDDPEPFVRVKAAEALCQAVPPPPAALSTLVEELRGRDLGGMRVQVAQFLEGMAGLAAPARPAVLRTDGQPRPDDPRVRLPGARQDRERGRQAGRGCPRRPARLGRRARPGEGGRGAAGPGAVGRRCPRCSASSGRTTRRR